MTKKKHADLNPAYSYGTVVVKWTSFHRRDTQSNDAKESMVKMWPSAFRSYTSTNLNLPSFLQMNPNDLCLPEGLLEKHVSSHGHCWAENIQIITVHTSFKSLLKHSNYYGSLESLSGSNATWMIYASMIQNWFYNNVVSLHKCIGIHRITQPGLWHFREFRNKHNQIESVMVKENVPKCNTSYKLLLEIRSVMCNDVVEEN